MPSDKEKQQQQLNQGIDRDRDVREMYNRTRHLVTSSAVAANSDPAVTTLNANYDDPDQASDYDPVQQERALSGAAVLAAPPTQSRVQRSQQRDISSRSRRRRRQAKKAIPLVEGRQGNFDFSPTINETLDDIGSPGESCNGDHESSSSLSTYSRGLVPEDFNNNINKANTTTGGKVQNITEDRIDTDCCKPNSGTGCNHHQTATDSSPWPSSTPDPNEEGAREELLLSRASSSAESSETRNQCNQLEKSAVADSSLASQTNSLSSERVVKPAGDLQSDSRPSRACKDELEIEQQQEILTTKGDQPERVTEWQDQASLSTLVYRGKPAPVAEQEPQVTDTMQEPTLTKYRTLSGPSGGRRRSSSGSRNGGGSISTITGRARETFKPMTRSEYTRLGYSHHHKQPAKSSILSELKRFLLLLIIVAICAVILWQIYEALTEEDNFLGVVKYSPSILGEYNHYAVSTDAEPCARIGKNLLAKGGHAVDAAIGTLLCMGVVLPNSLGLGGGCLMTIYDNVTKTATVIDGRETAPDYATEGMFSANPLSASRGPLSVGVPGELAAYWEAHQRFGRLNWSQLFDETIEMADMGFPTVEHLSFALRDMSHAKYITPPLAKLMTSNLTGEYYLEGEIMYQRVLAQTLRRIRDNGIAEFYNGTTGKLFVEDLHAQGGKLTLENLSRYRALVKEALKFELTDDLKVHTVPVPGSGVVMGIILRIMKELGHYKNETAKREPEAANLYYHHLIEAFKFAYAQRGALESDPDDPKRLEELLARVTSDEFIKESVAKINDDKTHPSAYYGGLGNFQEDHGTAHTSVLDNEGNSIAVTTSVNLYFGSGLVSPRTGIIYNDVMDDFTSPNITNKFQLLPSKYNRIRPGKRPLSSMSPSVFVDGQNNPRLILGASGGSKITTAIASVALRNLFMREDVKTAIDGARLHHQYLPDEIKFEANFPPEILTSLAGRGHKLSQITGRSSVVMAIACDYHNSTKKLTANSDYRKGGAVDGV